MEFIEYFEENCKKFPDVTALRSVSNKKGITYGQLNQYSASVYAYLKKNGIGKEQMVFVYLPRDTGMVVAMLGVIKAGAAFVLCEDTYPEDRVEFMKKDCGSILTIDNEIFAEMLAEVPLCGHEKNSPHDACFAVYTSGSTGTPKGVLHEYGKLMQMTESVGKIAPKLPAGSIHALSAPFNFVATLQAVLGTMYLGRCLFILPYDIVKDVAKLSKFIREEDVKEAFFSRGILGLYKENLYEGLVSVFCGAEAYNYIVLPKGICFNWTYCSSESAFPVSSLKVEEKCATQRTDKTYATPAGKNRIDVEILILDNEGHRLPVGQIGEICFKNEFTRGYINLPEKTTETFVNGICHMGDLGYINEDGELMVCGRKDDMIKIDGNRIEPAEIEAAIKNEFGIFNVVAKGFQDKNRSFICVYFLEKELKEKKKFSKADGSVSIDKDEFRKRLSKKLPYYMIPTYYSVLPSFPINANGKLAKNELKMPKVSNYQAEYVAPSNAMEEKLCNVMCDVLNLERIGATDDFYEIGGDSINTIKVITQMNLDKLDVNMFLTGRTPAKIVELYKKVAEGETESLDECNTQAQKKELPLSRGQLFMYDYQRNYPDSLTLYLPWLLKFGCDTDMYRLKKALDTVLKTHPVFSTMYVWGKNNELVQKFNPDKVFDTEIEEITEAEFESLKESLVQPFELLAKPLYDVRLFKTESGGYLFCNFHHSISDGTSLHIFLDDISKVYDGKTIESDYYFVFRDYYLRMIHSSRYEEAKQYYNKLLEGYEMPACLKTDFDTEDNTLDTINDKIPIVNTAYEQMQRMHGLSKNAFFIAVTCIAISAYNEKDNVIMTWIHNGRTNFMNAHVFGLLYNCFAIGMYFDKNKTLADVYRDVIEQIRNDIYYLCSPVWLFTSGDGIVNLNYLADMGKISYEGELSYTVSALSLDNDHSDNLLDIEILNNDNSCYLELKYNACAYKRESIERFSKMFIKTACLLTQNADNPNMRVEEIMKWIK